MCLVLFAATLAAPAPAVAAEPVPEIRREAVAPQQTGVRHTLRTIPEACARLEGEFGNDAAAPYRFDVVRTRADCQPRARLLDARKPGPSTARGWILSDSIRVPSASCPALAAVVQVWHMPATTGTPTLDAQGKARIYLDEARRKAEAGKLAPMPAYAVSMTLDGKRCGT